MSARRIALLITTIALTFITFPVASASAETPTLLQLRTELRQVRTHLQRASGTLASARTDLREVRAVVAAVGGLPAVVSLPVAAEPAPTPTPSPDATPYPSATPTLDTEAAGDTALSGTGTPDVTALVSALRPALAARLLADGSVTTAEVEALQARVVKWRRIVRRLRRAEASLEARIALRLQIAAWNRDGVWRPLIEIAAKRRGISADGLYRLMMAESGGRRFAGSTYKGLFQYYPGTWRASWNPWRTQSIYNGWAQIQATAYAIDRGMGPSSWPSTYWAAF